MEIENEQTREQLTQVVEQDDQDLQTHFVENPFIKIRERTLQKQKLKQHTVNLEEEQQEQKDVVLLKESGKFVIKEIKEETKKKGMLGKRKRDNSQEEADRLKRQKREQSKARAGTMTKAKEEGVHIVQHSGEQYKSTKGKGDVLKPGKFEPFAYIKLNPASLNKRNRDKAAKSFEGVITSGKKGRETKKNEGMLKGVSVKK